VRYEINCQAVNHAERAGLEGWDDGVLCTVSLPTGSPSPDLQVYCMACQAAADMAFNGGG
jgi:hypothetical protein